jgi:hypothetical protein
MRSYGWKRILQWIACDGDHIGKLVGRNEAKIRMAEKFGGIHGRATDYCQGRHSGLCVGS